MQTNDKRSPEQIASLPVLVIGTDRFLSGWGRSAGGSSFAAWACTEADARRVESWVRNRSDMKCVRVVSAKGYRPGRSCAHLTIYPVEDGHPARG